jgi:hypothetical protein
VRSNVTLTISSLLSIVLFTVHLAHDFVFGLDSMSRVGTLTFLLIMLVSLYGTVELAGRRSGFVVTLLLGVLAAVLPVLHTAGGPRSAGRGFFFVWTLLALGASGVFSAVLSARGLWRTTRGRSDPPPAPRDEHHGADLGLPPEEATPKRWGARATPS